MAMQLDEQGNFLPWTQPAYGTDAYDKPVVPPNGYRLLPDGTLLAEGDMAFDVYSGWLSASSLARRGYYSRSDGRWTTYARKVTP
jgi:hypothetical protein